MRILYVEDNPANLFLVQRVARMGSHEVLNYTSGEAALENFERDNPDLVLMDVQLAGNMTGLDAVRKLRGSGYQTPIIAVTAYAMIGDRERCLEAGCDDYLAKPLPVPKLVEIIRRYDPMQQDKSEAETNPATLPSRPTQELPPMDKMPYINKPAPTAEPTAPATPAAVAVSPAPAAPATQPAPAPTAPAEKPQTTEAAPTMPAPAVTSTSAAEAKTDEVAAVPAVVEPKAPEAPAPTPSDSNASTSVASTPVPTPPTSPAEAKVVKPEDDPDADPDAKTEPYKPAEFGVKKEDKA